MHAVISLHQFLNPKRLAYAWVIGGFLWVGWLISVLLGPGNHDLNDQIVGPDFVQFYTAGHILLRGASAQLYDLGFQQALQQELISGAGTSLVPFALPPFFAWLTVPFAKLPYPLSFGVWTTLGLLGLWLSLCFLETENPYKSFAWALTWFPIFAGISFGQNSLLSLALFVLIYRLWRRERLWAAGLASSLLLYKPQWIIVLGLFWLLEWRRHVPALAGLALGAGTLGLLSFCFLPEASRAYINFVRAVLPGWQTQQGFPLYHLHTVRGFWLLLLPQDNNWANLLYIICAGVGALGFVRFWRQNRDRRELLFAGIMCLTLWTSPHAMIYDWTILLIPAVLLWQELPHLRAGWKVLYGVIWLATFVSGLLTFAQLQRLPFAVQISVPAFLLVVSVAYRWLHHPPQLGVEK